MKTKNLLFHSSFILFIFLIFGNTFCSEASVQKINFRDSVSGFTAISDKLITRVFSIEKAFPQLEMINSKIKGEKLAILNNTGRRSRPDLLNWDIEVNHKIFKVYINRDNETITIQGEAEDWKEKELVEKVIKLRAPINFEIINKIDTYDTIG